ncbi:hypothetical protein Hanom_Chr17g01588771 [Helianthus anomalus]
MKVRLSPIYCFLSLNSHQYKIRCMHACTQGKKKTETSFEAFSLRLTRHKPRGEPRR